jgi:hypothetical protein
MTQTPGIDAGDLPKKLCPECGARWIFKPTRGPWPVRCRQCHRDKDAAYQSKNRAEAYNAYVRIVQELHERPKRKTSQADADGADADDGAHADEWDPRGGGIAWDETLWAWNPCRSSYEGGGWRVLPACRGPEITRQWSDVDRLMAEAEHRVRSVHRSAGTPVGALSKPRNEDAGTAGELWLKSKRAKSKQAEALEKAALEKAKAAREAAAKLAERKNAGGSLWDGMHIGRGHKLSQPRDEMRVLRSPDRGRPRNTSACNSDVEPEPVDLEMAA